MMLTSDQFAQVLNILPILQQADSTMRQEFQRIAYYARIPSGKDIFTQGSDVGAIALLISGTVRVYKISDTGREITLYRFSAGESCILSANAILSDQSFSAIATIEDNAEAVMIPADTFRDWVNKYELWREFVFDLLSQRLSHVMEIVEEVTFGRMDVRVATFLLERSKSQNPLITTHHEIAAELGSSREVISRILASLANTHMIQVKRGAIEVLDHELLQSYTLR